jgi:hypothetical protein
MINFEKESKKIKKQFKQYSCWKCKFFQGFYFDGVTFDCNIEGYNCLWDLTDPNCKHFKRALLKDRI